MAHRWLPKGKWLVAIPLLLALVLAVACGAASTPTSPPGQTLAPPAATTPPAPGATAVPAATPKPSPAATVAAGQPKHGGTVNMQSYVVPPHWSVYESNALSNMHMSAPLYNGLVEYNPETDDTIDLRGDLAKSWELAKDGLTYTFRLHENAKWHDGKPVTAEDVLFSLNSMVDPDKPRPRSGQIKTYYKSSKAIDPYTVEVTTQFPAPAFLPYLATEYMKILPKHHVETGVNLKVAENQLGSGPFKLVEYKKDVSMEYTRNRDYFKEGRPYLDGMRYFIIIDHGSVIAAFKAGQVLMSATAVSNLSNAEALQLEKDMQGKGKVYFGGPVGTTGLAINPQKEPFNDVRVRRAIYLAIHRQPLVQTFSQGKDLLGAPFPPDQWFSITQEELAKLPGFRETPDGQKDPNDLTEAKKLLAAAGYPDGFKATLTPFIVIEFVDIAGVLSDQLRRYLNIEVTIKPMEVAAGLAAAAAGNYELGVWGEGMLVLDPDAVFAGLYLKDAVRNYQHWEHPRMDGIFKLQTSEPDQQKRRALALEAAKVLLEEDNFWVSLYWTMRSWYVDNRIKNFHMPSNVFVQLKHEHLWLER